MFFTFLVFRVLREGVEISLQLILRLLLLEIRLKLKLRVRKVLLIVFSVDLAGTRCPTGWPNHLLLD